MGPAFSRKYNTLLVTGTTAIRIPMIKRAVVDFAVGADWTPANGDVKINIDGAGPTNVTNLPAAVASGNGAYWEFILTAAELSCKQAIVTIVDSATKAVEDNCFLVETFGNASAMYVTDLSASLATAAAVAAVQADTDDIQTRIPAALTANGNMKASLLEILTTALTETAGQLTGGFKKFFNVASPTLTCLGIDQTGDGYTRIGAPAGASISADIATVGGYIDTEVAAILAAVDTEVAAILALLNSARSEPAQGAPPVNPNMATKVDYLYKSWRNKKDNDGSTTKLYADDASTVDHKQTTSSSGGTVTKGEWATGP